jgi:hypothetical protein
LKLLSEILLTLITSALVYQCVIGSIQEGFPSAWIYMISAVFIIRGARILANEEKDY